MGSQPHFPYQAEFYFLQHLVVFALLAQLLPAAGEMGFGLSAEHGEPCGLITALEIELIIANPDSLA